MKVEPILPPILSPANSVIFDLESAPLLGQDESYAFSFLINRVNKLPPQSTVANRYETYSNILFNYKSIGVPMVTWYTGMGEHGIFRGEELLTSQTQATLATNVPTSNRTPAGVSPSSIVSATSANASILGGNNDFNKGIKLKCISVPGSVTVGEEFQVVIRVINSTSQIIPVAIWNKPPTANISSGNTVRNMLSLSQVDAFSGNNNALSQMHGSLDHLCMVGLSYINMGDLQSFDFKDITLSFYALIPGLLECKEVIALDTSMNKEYHSGILFKILVMNPQ